LNNNLKSQSVFFETNGNRDFFSGDLWIHGYIKDCLFLKGMIFS